MIVPFATLCDRCKRRSEEYSSWPTCRECLDDVCPDCYEEGSKDEADLDSPATCLCKDCAQIEEEDPGGLVEDERGDDKL